MSTVLEEVEIPYFKREIGYIKKDIDKPLVIFIGGIHGNEPMGVPEKSKHLFRQID